MAHRRLPAPFLPASCSSPPPESYAPLIREIPAEARPRERLDRYGPETLSTPELLAILLRTGAARESVLVVAERLLARFHNLRELSMASVDDLAQTRGIGRVKAIEIRAALELGIRLTAFTDEVRPTIRTASDVESLLAAEMRFLPREEFRVLLLNTKNQVLSIRTISTGTLNSSLVHPREVFREAIARATNSLIRVHNHPSGDPTPSQEDIEITRRLVEAGKLIDIQVLDHVIIGERRSLSLREHGLM